MKLGPVFIAIIADSKLYTSVMLDIADVDLL